MEASSSRSQRNGQDIRKILAKEIKILKEELLKELSKKLRNKRRKLSDSKAGSASKRKRASSNSSSSRTSSEETSFEESSNSDSSSATTDGGSSEKSFTTTSKSPKHSKPSTSTGRPKKRSRRSAVNKLQINEKIYELLDESLGESISDVPERIKRSLYNNIDESEYFELMKKYRIPSNFSAMRPKFRPKNLQLSSRVADSDDLFIMTQTKLSSVISAILSSLINVRMGPLSMQGWRRDTKIKLEDAAALSIHLQNELTKWRLANITSEIKSSSKKNELRSLFFNENDINDDETGESDNQNVLNYLENVSGDNKELPLPELGRKLVFLLHYTSHKNIETLSKLKLSRITNTDNGKRFEVSDEDVEFVIRRNVDNPKLCVIGALESYLQETRALRGAGDHLFLMNKRKGPHNPPVSSKRIADWMNDLRRESREWNLKNRNVNDTSRRSR